MIAEYEAVQSMDARDEIDLLTAIAQARDRDAFTELFERYNARAFNLALKITNSRALAEDAVQEAMLSLWKSRAIPANGARKWILKIVAHHCLTLMRNQKRALRREDQKKAMNSAESESASSATVEQRELMALLNSHINSLPDLERQLLALYYGAEQSQAEIGKLLSIPQQTISGKLQEALARLRANMTRAGVAAVVPLITSENLFEALTSGSKCPPGMTDSLIEQLAKSENNAVDSLSRRTAASGRNLRVPIAAGIVIFSAVAGGLWWHSQQKVSTPSTSAAVVPLTVPSAASKSVAFSRTWDFNAPSDLSDIQVQAGNWHRIERGGIDDSGCMEADGTKLALKFTVPSGHSAFAFTISTSSLAPTQQQPNTTESYINVNIREKVDLDFSLLRRSPSSISDHGQVRGEWTTATYYFADNYFICTDSDGLDSLHYFKRNIQYDEFTICIASTAGHVRLDGMTLRSIRADELPKISSYVNTVHSLPRSSKGDKIEIEVKDDPLHTRYPLVLRLNPDEQSEKGAVVGGLNEWRREEADTPKSKP